MPNAQWYTIRHRQNGMHIATEWTNPNAVVITTQNINDMMDFAKLPYAESFFTAYKLDAAKWKIVKWTMEDVTQ